MLNMSKKLHHIETLDDSVIFDYYVEIDKMVKYLIRKRLSLTTYYSTDKANTINQEAWVEICVNKDKFDASRGKLTTFINMCVRKAINKNLHKIKDVGLSYPLNYRKIVKEYRILNNERDLTLKESYDIIMSSASKCTTVTYETFTALIKNTMVQVDLKDIHNSVRQQNIVTDNGEYIRYILLRAINTVQWSDKEIGVIKYSFPFISGVQEHRSQAEIGVLLKCTQQSVNATRDRIKRKLKEEIQKIEPNINELLRMMG